MFFFFFALVASRIAHPVVMPIFVYSVSSEISKIYRRCGRCVQTPPKRNGSMFILRSLISVKYEKLGLQCSTSESFTVNNVGARKN